MIFRVADVNQPAFQLRKNEAGILVFDTEAVDPSLTEAEILEGFRAGSLLIGMTAAEIESKGLLIEPQLGADPLSQRLREAHAQIRPGPGMTRNQFKYALQELA